MEENLGAGGLGRVRRSGDAETADSCCDPRHNSGMADPTSRRLAAALRLRDALPAMVPARALFELQEAVPYHHAGLSRWDPSERTHRTVASLGYPAASLDVVNTRMAAHPVFEQLQGQRLPIVLHDVDDHLRTGVLFDTVITPFYSDGISQCLFAGDGRYLGMFNASTTPGHYLDDQSKVTIALLAASLAAALDPYEPSRKALPDSRPTALIAPDGTVVDGSRELPIAVRNAGAESARTGAPATYLSLDGTSVIRLEVTPTRGGLAVVKWHSIEPPMGLTRRELEVLALIPTGDSNTAIGARLGIGAATIATHVERVIRKVGVPNRTAAAVLATRWGLLAN